MLAPPRRLTFERRQSQAMTALALMLACVGAAWLNPDRPLPVDLCLFKRLTGLPCPTCGLTRAFCHAVRGNWISSVRYHPAGIMLAAAVIGWALWLGLEAANGVPWRDDLRPRLRTFLLVAGISLSSVNWIVHLISRAAP
jgi:hypothetical protein